MFAKLVTNTSPFISANVYFNTLINVITGSITSNTQLDATTFIPAASFIINTVPSGWTTVDSAANGVGTVPVLPGCPPVVIAAPWTDAANPATQQKYLYLAATNSTNSNIIIQSWPMDAYVSNSSGKFFFGAFNANANPSTSLLANTTNRTTTDVVSFMSSAVSQNGFTTIISSSQAHLLVATYTNYSTNFFNNYFLCSEYSRDDPWNTVGSGYPSWFIDVGSNNNGWAASTVTNVTIGHVARTINTVTGLDNLWTPSWTVTTGGNWGLASRAIPYGQAGISPIATGTFLPRGLSSAGQAGFFLGNQILARDANRNVSGLISEIRLINLAQGLTFNSNTMFAGGSVSAVNPYIFLFKSQYNTLDELLIGSNTYMNLVMNTNSPGSSNASSILVLER